MFKEKGYDEFLAQSIRQGLQDAENGRTLTQAQFQQEMQAVFSQIDRELALQQSELQTLIYG